MNNNVKRVSSSSGLIFNRLVLFSHIILLYNTPPQRSRVKSESISHKYFYSFTAAVVATSMFLIAFSFIYIIIIYVSASHTNYRYSAAIIIVIFIYHIIIVLTITTIDWSNVAAITPFDYLTYFSAYVKLKTLNVSNKIKIPLVTFLFHLIFRRGRTELAYVNYNMCDRYVIYNNYYCISVQRLSCV